jgi:predicted metal-dependent enzyme (double-stranded beta helix superfamily)
VPAVADGDRSSIGHERLEAILSELVDRFASSPVRPAAGRTYERLALPAELTGAVEAWRITWPPHTGLGMHDHRGSEAVLAVVRSSLRERFVDERGVSDRWLRPGSPVRLPTDHVHEVVNVGDEDAVSIHVYSPPLADTDFRTDPATEIVLAPGGAPGP